MEKLVRYTRSVVISELEPDGFWKVTAGVSEGRFEDGEWETRSISTMSLDKDLDGAFKTATTSMQRKLEDIDNNLFNIKKEDSEYEIPDPVNK